MNLVDIATLPSRRAPLPGGPTVRPLSEIDPAAAAAVLHVTLPAGGGMPEHDHGPSHVTLIPLRGRARLRHNGAEHQLDSGTAASIDVGDRVSLDNPWPEDAELLVVASPAGFVTAMSGWPTN